MGPKVGLWSGDGLFWWWKMHWTKRPYVLGRRDPSPEDVNSQLLSHPKSLSPLSLGFSFSSSPLFGRSLLLYIYIYISFVYPHPTLVSHPCLYLSACPIGNFFWHSVSCCGPYHTVQGSHPHQWGQGVSCGYLIRRWQLLLGLLFYHAPMASP